MSYSLSQWKQCVKMLKVEPDKPTMDICTELKMDIHTTRLLIFDVVFTWRIPRTQKFISNGKQKEQYVKMIMQP